MKETVIVHKQGLHAVPPLQTLNNVDCYDTGTINATKCFGLERLGDGTVRSILPRKIGYGSTYIV